MAMNRVSILMVLCLSGCFFPDIRGQSQPQQVAEQFFLQKLVENRIFREFRFEEPTRLQDIWIFECTGPAGFVLIQETDRCRVVGYSVENRFTRDTKIPDPALEFIESISQYSGPQPDEERLKTSYNPIGPLIRTKWSQEGYFNYFCPRDPNGPDGHVYTGCSAVAMGQIIRYFGKSNDFLFNAVFESPNYGTLTATLGNYDWNSMENQPITLDTEVSGFLFGMGVISMMHYGASSSTTSNYSVYEGFKKLKYYDAIRMVRATTNPETWIQNFYENIENFQPVYVSGTGHSFVCDGIDAHGFFHFNLGWYGYADGYYPLTQVLGINPSEAIFDLKPYSNNLSPSHLVLDTLDGQKVLKWEKNRLTATDPILYRVYLNDTTSFDTFETSFNTAIFPAGNHNLMVSAVYPQGESAWIGPIRLEVAGPPITIPDEALRSAIMQELALKDIFPLNGTPTINELLQIQKLGITSATASLRGLENCRNIQVLKISTPETTGLNLVPVTQLKRLKDLNISNIDSETLPYIALNKRLNYLNLTHCPTDNLNFLKELQKLLILSITDIPISDTQIFNNLFTLKELRINRCELTFGGFIQNLPDLEIIDLSQNLIQKLRLNSKLPSVEILDISKNQINELFFLEFITGARKINLADNKISRFITGLNFKNITELNLDNNSIDTVWFEVPMTSLTILRLHNNRIRNIEHLRDFAPQLTVLDLGGNLIPDFWTGSLQMLKYLDFSSNNLDLIDDIITNPSLKHVDLSKNRVTDIYPVFHHSNSGSLEYLNLSENPLSSESIENFTPAVRKIIDTLIIPENPQQFSPCYPVPTRNQKLSDQKAELSWTSQPLPPGSYYEVYTGSAPNRLNFAGQVDLPAFSTNISRGQHIYWRVKSVLPDTAYYSGLFNFVTFLPLSLPYKEDFERFPAFGYLTGLSDSWIVTPAITNPTSDAQIDPFRKFEGKQSLKLINASDVQLPMGHLYQSVLNLSMKLLFGNGCIGSVRFNNINGVNLVFYFKSNGRCDILMNDQLWSEILFPVAEWFSLQVNLYGHDNQVWIKAGSVNINIPLNFTGEVVHLDELELASTAGPFWPGNGQPVFYLDNLDIKASGSVKIEIPSTNTEVRIFPNPANEFVYVRSPEGQVTPEIAVYDFSGRMVPVDWIHNSSGCWKMAAANLTPGMYVVKLVVSGVAQAFKILICR